MSLRGVIGCFGFLARRSRDVGQPGLTVYTDAGIAAAGALGEKVRALGHANEVTELSLAARVKAMLADKQIDQAELQELTRLPSSLTRCAERSHDITEAMKP